MDVNGIRTTVTYSHNKNLNGLDAGVGYAETDGNVRGIQLGNGVCDVEGSVYGIQQSFFFNWVEGRFYGIQIGGFGVNMINIDDTESDSAGIQFAFAMNWTGTRGYFYGAQIAPLMFNLGNVCGLKMALIANGAAATATQVGAVRYVEGGASDETMIGVEIAGWINNAGVLKGVQLCSLNNRCGEVYGVQLTGLANRARDKMLGLQAGLVNSSDNSKGLQVGLVNYSRRMSGLQIGLVNIISSNAIPVLPAANFSLSFE